MKKLMCFNSRKWGGKDDGDNSQFWEEVRLVRTYLQNDEMMADVEWPDGTVTYGHIMLYMKEI